MNTRCIAALAAVVGFADVGLAQQLDISIDIAGATEVAPGQWEVDITGRGSGVLGVTVSGQLLNPGEILGLISLISGVTHTWSGISPQLANPVFGPNYDFGSDQGIPPTINMSGDEIFFQAGYNTVHFPATAPAPTGIGIDTAEVLLSYDIEYSTAPLGATIGILTEADSSRGTTQWFSFPGTWLPTGNVVVPVLLDAGATITFVPAPGAVGLLGLGGFVVARRRR